ncbi:hypothetical protein PVL29_025602 [Vitis rotundifolia]|uniref:PGG domain-containing protein n=1 Tax=Vitis rotundifolia TaxID=103349 RepID=A0AA38YKB2_VITRO|nr:hypothetical protein PVL29_025602 [Vitis rotundifolia]
MLMATLIATVTFAAAFTIPGGFKAEDIKAWWSTTSSMMAAVVLLIMPFRANKEIRESSLGVSVFLLWLAPVTMGIAFVTGLYALFSELLPLAIVVCCIGSIF